MGASITSPVAKADITAGSPPALSAHGGPARLAIDPSKVSESPAASQEGTPRAKLRLVENEKKAGTKPNHLLSLLRAAAPGRVRLAANMLYRGNDRARLARRAETARQAGVPLIAVNDVLYHHPDRRELQDVLTCIREHLTIDQAGRRLAVNAERYLKPPAEMARLFREAPEAIEETLALDRALTFSLDELRYEYPDEMRAGFATPQDALVHLAWEGAAARYPGGIPDSVRQSLDHELALIAQLKYAPYFLTVHHIVGYARSQNILCQGRGSAANSAVCYCLRITDVDPRDGNLLFERFISSDRGEPPDIDVDFEHERREEVIQHIYDHYGRDHTGIAATVISYRGRSAIREVGKAFGLSEDTIGALSSSIWGMGGGAVRTTELARAGIDVNSPRMEKMRALAMEIQSFPRHLSQHVGGFVITRSRLDEVMPIGNGAMKDRTFVEWDKDDLDALGILKIDVLGLGMLTCLRKAFELTEKHYGVAFRSPRPEENNGKRIFRPLYDPERRAAGLSHAAARRLARRIPGREPRADVDAAASQAEGILRSRDRSRDRAAGPDPGRHGASLSAPPAGHRAGFLSLEGARSRPRKDARRPPVPGTGDEDRHRRRRFHAGRSRSSCAAPWRPSSAPAPSALSGSR